MGAALKKLYLLLLKHLKENKMKAPTKAQKKIGKVMHEYKAGELHSGSKKGPAVTNRKQAVAIAMSEAKMPMRGERTAKNKAKKMK